MDCYEELVMVFGNCSDLLFNHVQQLTVPKVREYFHYASANETHHAMQKFR